MDSKVSVSFLQNICVFSDGFQDTFVSSGAWVSLTPAHVSYEKTAKRISLFQLFPEFFVTLVRLSNLKTPQCPNVPFAYCHLVDLTALRHLFHFFLHIVTL